MINVIESLECAYKDKCTSRGISCGSCKHNTGKKDYYEKGNKDFWIPRVGGPWTTPYCPSWGDGTWTVTCRGTT